MEFKTNENFAKMSSHYVKVEFPVSDRLKLESKIALDKDHYERWNLQNAQNLKLVAQ